MSLKPDDFEVGMIVTVLRGCPLNDIGLAGLLGMGEVITETKTQSYDNSYKGDLLKVKAVSLPYLCLERISKYKHNCNTISLDTRRWIFTKLSQDYIDEMMKDKTI